MKRCSKRCQGPLNVLSKKCWPACSARTSKKALHISLKNAHRCLPENEELSMNFEVSEKTKELQQRVRAFMDSHVYPNEEEFQAEIAQARWKPTRIVEDLKAKVRHEGLWNLFLPQDKNGAGLTNLEYAPLCEIMGRSHMGPEG